MESDSDAVLQSYGSCCNHTAFPSSPEVPSAPSISEVRPFSTTAQIQFEEPESTGGVPVLKYRVEWRTQDRGNWVQKLFEAQDGKNINKTKITLFRREFLVQS